jgi:hypothetical protein
MTHAEVVTLNDQTDVTSHVHSCDSERTGRRPYLRLLVGGPDLPGKEAFAPLATRGWTPPAHRLCCHGAAEPVPVAAVRPAEANRGPLLLICVLGVVLAVGAVVLLRDNESKSAGSAAATRQPAREAVQFRRVLKADPAACGASSAGTAAPAGTACGSDGTRYTLGRVELDGGRVSEVKAAVGHGADGYVDLSLDQEGTRLFDRLTTELAAKTPPQNQLAILVRGRVVTAPTVVSPISGGNVEISASFTKQDAEKLVAEITG